MADELIIDETDYKRLKELYDEAIIKKAETFTFKDRPILTSYAKYLLEFLKQFLKP